MSFSALLQPYVVKIERSRKIYILILRYSSVLSTSGKIDMGSLDRLTKLGTKLNRCGETPTKDVV